MIVAAQHLGLCYTRRRTSRLIPWCSSGIETNGTARIRPGFSPAACAATPRPSRAILKCGLGECVSHGRGTRPRAPKGALAWQGRRFALPLHPSRAGVSHPMHPCGEPSCSLRPKTGALPRTHQGASPLEPDEGLSHPSAHSPETIASRHPRPELACSGQRAGGFHAPAP